MITTTRLTTRTRLREHRVQARMRNALERSFQAALAREFTRVANELADSYKILDLVIREHRRRLAPILSVHYTRIMREFGGKVIAAIRALPEGKSVEAHVEECKSEMNEQYVALVRTFVGKWTAVRVNTITETTRRRAATVIERGINEGLGEDEIGAELRDKIGGIAASRARTIARTETHSASQDAQFEVAQASGLDMVKEWVAIDDDRTRDEHAEVNGDRVAMHESFTVGDDELLYPGDPSGSPEEVINCRCVCVYEPV
jgi:SPP1 gp7 family putative phage head morphogenesis protein